MRRGEGLEAGLDEDANGERKEEPDPGLPFPDSLCHTCAAPPKYIRTSRSVFLFCPIFRRYPPQPVAACPEYAPAPPRDSPA